MATVKSFFYKHKKIWKAPLLYFVFFIFFSFRFKNSGHVVWDTLHSNYYGWLNIPYSYYSFKLDKMAVYRNRSKIYDKGYDCSSEHTIQHNISRGGGLLKGYSYWVCCAYTSVIIYGDCDNTIIIILYALSKSIT